MANVTQDQIRELEEKIEDLYGHMIASLDSSPDGITQITLRNGACYMIQDPRVLQLQEQVKALQEASHTHGGEEKKKECLWDPTEPTCESCE